MFEPADFLEESLRWAARVLHRRVTVERAPVDTGPALGRGGRPMARWPVEGKLHGAAPAPLRALDLVAAAKDRSRDEGFAAEDDALADLIMSDELRVRAVRLRPGAEARQAARRVPRTRPWPGTVTKVGVVGAGLMASQLGLLFARRLGVPVVLTDLDQARLDKGVAYVHAEVDKLLGKGRVSADEASELKGLVSGSLTKDAFADADFVIEAVFEEMGVKQQVFAEVEAVVSPECVLATNTSSLSVTEMAVRAAAPRAGRGLPLLQPGRGAAAAGDRPGRARPTTRRWPRRSPSARR